jgi:hypothetical protein
MTLRLMKTAEPADATDAELARLADYTSGRMSDIEAKLLEKQLADDPEFSDRMAPWLDIWMPGDRLPIIEETLAEVREDIARYEARKARRAQWPGFIRVMVAAYDRVRAEIVLVMTTTGLGLAAAVIPLVIMTPNMELADRALNTKRNVARHVVDTLGHAPSVANATQAPHSQPVTQSPPATTVAAARQSASNPPVIVAESDAARALMAAQQPLPAPSLTPSAQAVAIADNTTALGGRPYYHQRPDTVHKGYTNTVIIKNGNDDGGIRDLIRKIFGRIRKPPIHLPKLPQVGGIR